MSGKTNHLQKSEKLELDNQSVQSQQDYHDRNRDFNHYLPPSNLSMTNNQRQNNDISSQIGHSTLVRSPISTVNQPNYFNQPPIPMNSSQQEPNEYPKTNDFKLDQVFKHQDSYIDPSLKYQDNQPSFANYTSQANVNIGNKPNYRPENFNNIHQIQNDNSQIIDNSNGALINQSMPTEPQYQVLNTLPNGNNNINNSNNMNSKFDGNAYPNHNNSYSQHYSHTNIVQNSASHDNSILKPFELERDVNTSQEQSQSQTNRSNFGREKNFYFYADLSDDYQSHIFPKQMINPGWKVFYQFLVPFIVCFCIHCLVWAIQDEYRDFCFVDSVCYCEDNRARFWSFVRQMVLFKLGLISQKRVLISSVQNRPAYVQGFLLYFFCIGLDFIFVMVLDFNQDWGFLIYTYVIGNLIHFHSLQFKEIQESFLKAKGLVLYDVYIFLAFIYIYYAIPAIFNRLTDTGGYNEGKANFIYLFPIIEWPLEIVYDLTLSRIKKGEFFFYQVQLLFFGLKLGVLLSINPEYFQFWYLIIFTIIKRFLNMSMLLTINFRKVIHESLPQSLRFITSMEEMSEEFRGKQGSMVEHVVWILIFYWLWGIETILPWEIKNIAIIQDCRFNVANIFNEIEWFRPFMVWLFFLVPEISALITNNNVGCDVIKWVGSRGNSLFDNIMTRMTGWYLFQLGLTAPFILFPLENRFRFNN